MKNISFNQHKSCVGDNLFFADKKNMEQIVALNCIAELWLLEAARIYTY
jgi:hypothetical protein